jgi:hypothetical protein
MCPLGWRLIVVSMGSVWREQTVDLGVQSNETFGNNSDIVARAFADDLEMMPHVFAHPAHFYPKSRFYSVNLRVEPCLDAINLRAKPCLHAVYTDLKAIDTATKSIFEMPQIVTKGLDCCQGFDVHR